MLIRGWTSFWVGTAFFAFAVVQQLALINMGEKLPPEQNTRLGAGRTIAFFAAVFFFLNMLSH